MSLSWHKSHVKELFKHLFDQQVPAWNDLAPIERVLLRQPDHVGAGALDRPEAVRFDVLKEMCSKAHGHTSMRRPSESHVP
jgi:hypothetical protein